MSELAGYKDCIIYTVGDHETLSDIFRRFDVSINTLMALNERRNLFELKKGQTLIIKRTTRGRKDGYVLGANETLRSVAEKFGISVSALLKANAAYMPQEIRQGICITLPKKRRQGLIPVSHVSISGYYLLNRRSSSTESLAAFGFFFLK